MAGQKGDLEEKLYERALRLLSYRPRSEKEIKDYLQRKGAPPKISAKIIGYLKKQGLINDQEFAAWWVKQRCQFRPKGRRVVWWELKQKGLDEEIINDSLFSAKEELALAKKAIGRRKREREKLISFLARRGFDWEIIKLVLAEKQKKG